MVPSRYDHRDHPSLLNSCTESCIVRASTRTDFGDVEGLREHRTNHYANDDWLVHHIWPANADDQLMQTAS
ncbi:hypothetical protein FOCG_05063 [Fusarium oxysporum f. sp. radicis-lycopersici 26381]|nr:hypothetical protein FOCG_05063 [Fusarium oxysporum f. sp. radicis-lycopersici 26381]